MHAEHPHKIVHDPMTHRWKCPCGYTLGDGRERYMAACPITAMVATRAKRRNAKRPNEVEFNLVGGKPQHEALTQTKQTRKKKGKT
jgi:hypothetical protein